MSNDDVKLTKKQEEELRDISFQIISDAEKVVEDYEENPSDMSGSYVHIHENSPYLKERHERLINFNGKKIKIKPDKLQ